MLCLGEDTQLPELLIKILHIFGNSCLDVAEIMIFKFLTLRSFSTEKGSACKHKILTLIVKLLINKEVFLFRTYCCYNSCAGCISEES